MWKYVIHFSLDPFQGFLHAERPGRISLVYDLIEPFRPIMDRFVASYLRHKGSIGSKGIKREVIVDFRRQYYDKFLSIKFTYRGKKHRIETVMFLYVEDIVSYLHGRKTYIPTPYIPW